jgi:hypothetical protein
MRPIGKIYGRWGGPARFVERAAASNLAGTGLSGFRWIVDLDSEGSGSLVEGNVDLVEESALAQKPEPNILKP